jgi:tRNA (uracil-5-)-methyltransferase
MKCNTNTGLIFVDYPKDLPHISDYSVECAEKVQALVRDFEANYGLQEYKSDVHTGCWRTLLYKESKKTNEVLISIAISRNSMIDNQYDQFKKDFLKLWEGEERVVCVSIIESDSISGNYEHYDKVVFLTDRKTYHEELNGFKFSVSPQAFFQVNTNVFEKMLMQIKHWADLDENTVLLDV